MSKDESVKALDYVLLGFVTIATIPFILANLVILFYRKRRYFQAQGGVGLILGGSVAGITWILSSIVVNGHVERKGILRLCVLWTFWLKTSFGICLWLVCIILRLHRMYLLSKERDNWKYYALGLPLLMLPTVILSIIATRMESFDDRVNCTLKIPWRINMWVTLLLFYFCVALVVLFRLRGQKDLILSTEYVHTCDYAVMAFIIYLLSAVTYITKGKSFVAGRCFLTFCVCCLVFLHFWIRMGSPVYLCLFKPESEMVRFEENLRRSGATIIQVISAAYNQTAINLPSSEGAILEAFSTVTEEADDTRRRIEKLSNEKALLMQNVEILRQRLRSYDSSSSSSSS